MAVYSVWGVFWWPRAMDVIMKNVYPTLAVVTPGGSALSRGSPP